MARYKGYNAYFTAGGNPVGERTQFDIEITVAEFDATVQGLNWTSVEAGQKSASGSLEVLTDPADTGQVALVAGDIVALELFPEGNTAGLSSIAGDFLITSVSKASPVGDLTKTTYQFRNNGEITLSTVA